VISCSQKAEADVKAASSMFNFSRPADEWRWLKYGYNEFGGMMPLLENIHSRKLNDPGTGSTFKALAERNLILLRHEKPLIGDPIPFIRMTPKGRKLVRTAIGEVRPKKQPAGTLREWHWRALVLAYLAEQEEKEGIPQEWGLGDYGGISWNTWLRLWNYRLNGESIQLVKEHENRESTDWQKWYYVIRITPAGREFYIREWKRYRKLYPDVDAPEPNIKRENEHGQNANL
jgi:hypothetical protein